MGFSGTVAIRAMKDNDYQATIFPGTEAGLVSALAYAGSKGAVKTGPGDLTISSIIAIPDGACLELGSGTYTFTGVSGVSVGNGSALRGQGYNSTSLKVGSTFTGNAVVFNTTQDGTQQYSLFEHFEINGDKASGGNPSNGIFAKGLGQTSVIRDVVVFDMAQRGITVEGVLTNAAALTYIDNCWVNNCDDHSIVVQGAIGAVTIYRVSVENIPAGKNGIYIDGTSGATDQGGIWLRDIHCEDLAAGAAAILLEDTRDVTVENALYFGSGGTGDLVRITGTAGVDSVNHILINLYVRFNATATTVNDVSNGVTLTNEVPFYSTGTLRTTGNVTFGGASASLGTAGVAHSTTVGQGGANAAAADLTINSGNTGATAASFFIRRNAAKQFMVQCSGSAERIEFANLLVLGTAAGATVGALTTLGKLRLGDNAVPTNQLEVVGDTLLGTGSAPIKKVFSATASLNFDLTAVVVQDLTITVTGAAVGDTVMLGVPNGSVTATVEYTGWVSGVNTVTVRARTAAVGENPASGTFRATVIQF